MEVFQPVVPEDSAPGGLAGSGPIALHMGCLQGLAMLLLLWIMCGKVLTLKDTVLHTETGLCLSQVCYGTKIYICSFYIYICMQRLLKAENTRYPGTHLHSYAFIYPGIYTTAFNTAADEQKLVPLNVLLICLMALDQ